MENKREQRSIKRDAEITRKGDIPAKVATSKIGQTEEAFRDRDVMMKKNGIIVLFTIIAVMFFAGPALASYAVEEIAAIQWGQQENQLGFYAAYDGHYGPQSFVVTERGTLVVLDTMNRRIKELDPSTGELRTICIIGESARDLAIERDGSLVVLYPDRIQFLGSTGQLRRELSVPAEFPFVRGLRVSEDGEGFLELARGDSLTLSGLKTSTTARQALKTGVPGKDGKHYQVELIDEITGRILIFSREGVLLDQYDFMCPRLSLGTVQFIGADVSGTMYLELELIVSERPIVVDREILIVAADGNLVDLIDVPDVTATHAERDLRVDSQGILYHMQRDVDGVRFYRLVADDSFANGRGGFLSHSSPYHYNDLLVPVDEKDNSPLGSDDGRDAALDSISLTRSEALAIGDSYVARVWTASSCNIGSVYCGGKTVTTPSWVTVGTKQRIPYQWGGFSSISGFTSGLTSCLYAGDKDTNGGASSCAIGVDCSGFVSRCWKTTTKYGTSTLPNISFEIALSSMKAGDIFNLAGSHVRMFVSQNANGTYNCVESYAGSNYWRVDYTVRTAADNSSYTPRRCNWISDDYDPNRPGTKENPLLISTWPYTNSNTTLNGPSDQFDYYSCATTTNESGPEVFYRFSLTTAATVTVSVSDGSGIDVDVHLLSSPSTSACMARNDVSFTYASLPAGTYYITADTYVSSTGVEYAGPYTLTVSKN